MKRLRLLAASILVALSLSLAGCGGSGGSSADNGGNGSGTVIKGMASKGPITGTVAIYALNSGGGKGSLLTTVPVTDGSYSANLGGYTGAVVIEASGTYTDEATGRQLAISAAAPLRAAIAGAYGEVSVAVTPLTELAVQKSGALTQAEITAGNKLVSDIFRFDIIGTAPVAPTAAGLASATQSQKDYTLALAALSQLSDTVGKPMSGTLADVAAGIGTGGMDSQTLDKFETAAATFIVLNGNNKTGVRDLSGTTLDAITGQVTATASYSIAIPAGVAANSVTGLEFELVLPAGLTLKQDSTGALLPGVVTLAATTEAAQPYLATFYSSSTGVLKFALMTATGIGSGTVASIACDVLPGYSAPAASAFSVRSGSIGTVGGIGEAVSIPLVPTIN